MKKIMIIALSVLVSACACFECEDAERRSVTYRTTKEQKLDCDYFDGKTCYRYVYKNIQRNVVKPAPMRYRPCHSKPLPKPVRNCDCPRKQIVPVVPAQPQPIPQPKVVENNKSDCPDKVSETREPVEIVYKKVITRTTYEPKTTSEVVYEKLPYDGTKEVNVSVSNVTDTTEVVTPAMDIEEIK